MNTVLVSSLVRMLKVTTVFAAALLARLLVTCTLPDALFANAHVVVPAALAYGDRGAGCRAGECEIPPGSTLVFEVELVSVR